MILEKIENCSGNATMKKDTFVRSELHASEDENGLIPAVHEDRGWTDEDDDKLISLVREHGHHHGSWKIISTIMNRGDENECESRYLFKRSQIKVFNYWTEEEDSLLRSLVRSCEGKKPNWRLISSYLPTRTTAAIKTHWRDLQKRESQLNETSDIENTVPTQNTQDEDNEEFLVLEEALASNEYCSHTFMDSSHGNKTDSCFELEFQMQKALVKASDSVRCNSEDSQATSIPDADSQFVYRYLDQDIITDDNYPSSKRFRSDDGSSYDAFPWRCYPPTDSTDSFYPSLAMHCPVTASTSSYAIPTSNSFYDQTTRSTAVSDGKDTNDHTEISGFIQSDYSYDSYDTSSNCHMLNIEDGDDVVSSFIESFCRMDDEDTRLDSSMKVGDNDNDNAVSYHMPEELQSFDFDPQQFQSTSVASEAPRRPITSWETAKQMLPNRLRKHHDVSNNQGIENQQQDFALKTSSSLMQKRSRTNDLPLQSQSTPTKMATRTKQIKPANTAATSSPQVDQEGDTNTIAREDMQLNLGIGPLPVNTQSSVAAPALSIDEAVQEIKQYQEVFEYQQQIQQLQKQNRYVQEFPNDSATYLLPETSGSLMAHNYSDCEDIGYQEVIDTMAPTNASQPSTEGSSSGKTVQLVYLPCIYMSTPNQALTCSAPRPSMHGLCRPPPGFRFIQAPALVPGQIYQGIFHPTIPTPHEFSSFPQQQPHQREISQSEIHVHFNQFHELSMHEEQPYSDHQYP